MPQSPRRAFVAGATGSTGRTVCRLAGAFDLPIVPHFRPTRAANEACLPPNAAVFDLADAAALGTALGGCTTVLQLIGTMRKRFSAGDTYQTSDIGTTQLLVDAARAGDAVDHLVLLSSVGAGRPVGAYLKAKAAAEAIVIESGVPYTIVRPSAFDGEGHRSPPGMGGLTRLLGLRKYQPIKIATLAALILAVAQRRGPLGVLEGASLWEAVGQLPAEYTR